MANRMVRAAIAQLGRRGYVVRRHPGVRRQALLAAHGVDVVYDVGAAVGEFGKELRHFGYAGSIVSFEPLEAAHATLAAVAAPDPAWTVHHCALGSAPGHAKINVASNSDSSSLLPMGEEHRAAAPGISYVDSEEIEVRRLDDVTAAAGERGTGYLKIDVQGFEPEVLAGGQDTLASCVGLQLELSFVPLYEGGPLIDEMLARVYDLGFRMRAIDPGFAAPGGAVLQADGIFFRD